jgi:hypothetical protein
MSRIFPLRKLLGSSRAGTSPLVVMGLPAFLPIPRVRIILAPCPRLLNTPLLMINLLTLPIFILFLHPLPSSNPNHRIPFPLIIFLLSLRSRLRSPFHPHLRSLCTSVTLRRSFLPCRFRSTPQEHLYLRLGLTAPCPLSLRHTRTLTNFPSISLSHPHLQHMPLPQGRGPLPRLTRSLRHRQPLTSVTPWHPNKTVYKSRLLRKASVHVVTVAQVEVRVSAVHHSAAVANRRVCSSPPAVAETGAYLRFLHLHLAEEFCATPVVEMNVASLMCWPTVT